MPTVKIYLFGQLRVECGNRVWQGPEGYKSRELFCFLLIHRTILHNRERLASLLWEESSAVQSKKYLRQALWKLQSSCNEQLGEVARQLLLVDPEWVQINSEVDLWVDVSVFDQTYSRLQAARDLNQNFARTVDQAVRLYKEDLLVGWYQGWCLYERERLQNMYLTMLDRLVEYCEANQDYLAGQEYCARILHYDPARERTHQQMMEMYYLAGDRTAALRQFDRCVEALKRELDVGPALSTLALREQIGTDHFVKPATALHSPPAVSEPLPSLPSILVNLKQLQSKLVELQCELQQGIQTVEQAFPQLKDPN
jgi:DNA-binding SARP family transcriptional activator